MVGCPARPPQHHHRPKASAGRLNWAPVTGYSVNPPKVAGWHRNDGTSRAAGIDHSGVGSGRVVTCQPWTCPSRRCWPRQVPVQFRHVQVLRAGGPIRRVRAGSPTVMPRGLVALALPLAEAQTADTVTSALAVAHAFGSWAKR